MRPRPSPSPLAYEQPLAPAWVLAAAFAGAMSALAGGYWDDAWHTDRGRDEFFIAPHIAIYAGVAAAGAALTLWAMLSAREYGLSVLWRHKPLALALLSVAVTLASGPIDNAWHIAFGRDSVIWSAPHMLGIAGTLALGAAILAELAGRPENWARRLAVVAGALVLASAGFTSVEYDADVPQFNEVFYLPVLGFAASIGLVLVRAACDGRWAATVSATVYTVFVLGVAGFLALVDFPPPALPLLVVPAVVVDVATRQRWHPALTAAFYTLALHAAYVPVRNLLGEGVRIDVADVLGGGALTFLATLVVFALTSGRKGILGRSSRRLATGAAAGAAAGVMLLLVVVPAARAHDPGQGEAAGTVALRASVDAGRATVTVTMAPALCRATQPRGLVARRGGETVRAQLTKRGCRLQGALRLPERGRWFIYAQMRRYERPLESWLPVSAGPRPQTVSDPNRYAYFPSGQSSGTVKLVASLLLYAAMLALLYATFALIRSSRERQDAGTHSVQLRTRLS